MEESLFTSGGRVKFPIATKLILGFLLIITLISVVFSVVGVRLISDRIVVEAQEKVSQDLNSAREIYLSRLNQVNDVVRHTAGRVLLLNALFTGNSGLATDELRRTREREGLDILSVTDVSGKVVLRTTGDCVVGDRQDGDELIRGVVERKQPVASTSIVPVEDLRIESPALVEKAYFKFIDTPKDRPRAETEERAGMMLKAAAPIFNHRNLFIGILYGGILLNRNYDIVDKIKHTVYQNMQYQGKDIGTATIFQDDVRISTNVKNSDGSRAIGTRVAADVYDQVVGGGQPWTGRAYVVNDWYITAYEPIRNINNRIIGILYVGVLEQKYEDIKRRTILAFLAITLAGALVAVGLSYLISRRISGSIRQLVSASHEVAQGNLDASVRISSSDELQELAATFNLMASALKKRDQQLKDAATKKIMESERLAIIGQLGANVAHELNNPLQGIVTYSRLLLEKTPEGGPSREWIQKIVTQSTRCTGIIRSLLDFSRQRKTHKRPGSVNSVLHDCLELVVDQALFHNINVVRDLQPDLPPVLIDPSQIQQVFMNILINAAEAMEGEGRLEIVTRLDAGGDWVEVGFTDSGHGITQEHIERIFDPFFTTKEVVRGTGLGLAISYGIIKEHNGAISVESEVGMGTTFTIRLPVAPEEGNGNGEKQNQDSHHR